MVNFILIIVYSLYCCKKCVGPVVCKSSLYHSRLRRVHKRNADGQQTVFRLAMPFSAINSRFLFFFYTLFFFGSIGSIFFLINDIGRNRRKHLNFFVFTVTRVTSVWPITIFSRYTQIPDNTFNVISRILRYGFENLSTVVITVFYIRTSIA